ncbi:hypothetical protein V247_02224, partial [Staphylococcus aureus F63712]
NDNDRGIEHIDEFKFILKIKGYLVIDVDV